MRLNIFKINHFLIFVNVKKCFSEHWTILNQFSSIFVHPSYTVHPEKHNVKEKENNYLDRYQPGKKQEII